MWYLCTILNSRVFWDVLPHSQIDVDICLTTRQYIPEDSELPTRRRVKLKCHLYHFVQIYTVCFMCLENILMSKGND
jgi:hypothetical protein